MKLRPYSPSLILVSWSCSWWTPGIECPVWFWPRYHSLLSVQKGEEEEMQGAYLVNDQWSGWRHNQEVILWRFVTWVRCLQMDFVCQWHTKSIWHCHGGRSIWNRHIAEFIRPYIWTRLNVTSVFCPVVYLIIWLPWFDETTNISRRGLVFLWVESRVSRLDLRI